MTPEQEQQVLATLYTRLFDAITFSPGGGKTAPFDKATTFLQFSKNEALNPADFANAATPVNPGGSLNSAELFSRMVDTVPALQADYAPSGNVVSTAYRAIVNGADTLEEVTPEQQKIYKAAYGYLNTITEVTDFTGAKVQTAGPSQIATTYQANLTAYIAAVAAYRNAYNSYDLTKIDQQRAWQANEPLLNNAVTQAYNTWRSQGAAQVEQAQAALASSVNSAVRNAIADAQQAVAAEHQMASSLGAAGSPWFMSYALPTNWADPSAVPNLSALTIDSSALNQSADASYSSYGGGASWGGGFWSVGGSAQHSEESTQSHMDSESIKLSAKLGIVRIFRPWLHEFVLRMNGWFLNGTNKGGISNGALAGNSAGLLPLIPTAFIVARDVSISGLFGTDDATHAAESTSGRTSVGWGPFSVSGSYSHSESHDTHNSTFSNGTLTIPGLQIIAWVSEIVPASPPMDPPQARTPAPQPAVPTAR